MSESLATSVPGPIAPDDPQAWYAPSVRSQYHVADGIVATVAESETAYSYRTRQPQLSERETTARDRAETRFDESPLSRPQTRAGAVERIEIGFPDHIQAHLPELSGRSPASRRRLRYHLLASLRSLGAMTPLALDEQVQIADTTGERLVVHTREFAPAKTDLPDDTSSLDRFLGERISRTEISFAGIEVPVTIVRSHLLGADTFDGKYVVDEPDLLPGDQAIIETVSERILETPPADVLRDELDGVLDRARTLIQRRISYRPLKRLKRLVPWTDGPASTGPGTPQARPSERVDALAYYVARDLVGDGKLTIPMRDPAISSIEVNRVGDRIAVVPHRDHAVGSERLPTSFAVDDLSEFVDLARSLSADGGVELSVTEPTATVTVARDAGGETRELHCSVSLPTRTDHGHVSISADRSHPPTPLALVEQGTLSPELVAAVWTVAANRGTVVFVGPVDAEPALALEAHTPFVPATERQVAFGADADSIDLPHETGLSVGPGKSDRTLWPSRRERDALHPDVAVVPGLVTPRELERLEAIIASGRPVFAAVQRASRTLFGQLLQEAEIEHAFGAGVDLVVELQPPKTSRAAIGWIPTVVSDSKAQADGEFPGSELAWTPFVDSTVENGPPTIASQFLNGLATGPKAEKTTIERTFARRYRYVEYLLSEGSTDRDSLMNFLADLRTNEPATIERLQRQ